MCSRPQFTDLTYMGGTGLCGPMTIIFGSVIKSLHIKFGSNRSFHVPKIPVYLYEEGIKRDFIKRKRDRVYRKLLVQKLKWMFIICRKLLRSKRQQKNYPIVAVVGYTNAGKTALIKALTQEESMQPRNQLFATLDVTAHAGKLPCNLEVIFMDTVGFMADIPTGLIECFVATLEDAMLAVG